MRKVELPFKVARPILACGADIKGAFALAIEKHAILEEGFGDLADPDNLARYEKAVLEAERRSAIKPEAVACDLHPGYFSTRFAERRHQATAGSALCRVQHHEAHIASAIAEHGIKGDCLGVAFDGTGFGRDRRIWGGEFFAGGLKGLTRRGHLEYVPMPGGEAAVRQPWRMAASYLYRVFGDGFLDLKIDFLKQSDRDKLSTLKTMIDKKINAPLTSSMGRLFDAVGSLVLVKMEVKQEAELPVELERIARASCQDSYDFDISPREDGGLQVSVSRTIAGVVRDLSGSVETPEISGKFHNTAADIILKTSLVMSKESGIRKVVLSGGVFQNRLLTAKAAEILRKNGFDVYTHSKIAAGDAGIPIGQIVIANARSTCA